MNKEFSATLSSLYLHGGESTQAPKEHLDPALAHLEEMEREFDSKIQALAAECAEMCF